jgi:L-histidine N-alpha-methyltransferase
MRQGVSIACHTGSIRFLPALRCHLSIHASLQLIPRRLSLVRVLEKDAQESFGQAVHSGLSSSPKTLPCKYFYDDTGSRLFEEICQLPEYYLTRTEDAILRIHAEEMLQGWAGAGPVLIELGSGSSIKTRRLLGAALDLYGSAHYVPIDVSPAILESSARDIVHEFGRLRVTAYAGDYQAALDEISRKIRGPKCFVFLGSSLGNYPEPQAIELLCLIAQTMGTKDRLLLGTDLVKDRSTLEAAYDDSQNVTAAFNRNLLVRINRELDADFDLRGFKHRAIYREEFERVEMHLVSSRAQTVRIPGADLVVDFAPGESIHTENSHKYTTKSLAKMAEQAGFAEEASWTDAKGWFRLQRWRLA